jgi:hypothetical protein
MACSIFRNSKTKEIERVLAPNGMESKLFSDIDNIMGPDAKEESLKLWAQVYTDQFKEWFGDWEKLEEAKREQKEIEGLAELANKVSDYVDDNGEPLLEDGFFTNKEGDSRLFYQTLQQSSADTAEDYVINTPLNDRVIEVVELSSQEVKQSEVAEPEVKEALDTKIIKFLEKIGVSIHAVDTIKDREGKVLDATAKAQLLNRIIQVVDGLEDIDTLPEEAAHFFVEMLGPGHPLMKDMMSKITGFKIYTRTVDQYKNQKAYRNPDGTINFDKLKKEAIAQVIAQHIIKFQQGDETDQKISTLMHWWNKLWDLVKSVFTKVEDNPFETAASKILEGDTSDLDVDAELSDEEYYQLTDPLQGLKADQNNITLDNSVDPRTGQKRHDYKYKNEKAKGSVTSVYVDRWLKKIFRSDQRSEKQKIIDLSKAGIGDIIHEQIQNIVKSWTYVDGTKRDEQGPIDITVPQIVYKKLNDYIQSVMSQYEPGTKFFSEIKIFDQKAKIGGSIDFLVVQNDGVVDIYDWKSQEIAKNQDDLKTYKETMYRIQLENYRKILQLQYGFQKFGKIRSIPIKTTYVSQKGTLTNVKDIEVGNIDPSMIPDNKSYLLPVTLKSESTGSNQLDLLIKKLNGIYDKIDKSSYTKEELYKKREELGQLRVTIRDLQLKGRIDRLVELGLLEYKKYAEMLKDRTIGGKDIQEALKILKVFSESGVLLYDLKEQYAEVIKNSNKKGQKEAFDEMNERFLTMTSRVSKLVVDLEEYQKEIVDALGKRNGIFNVLNPEAPLNFYRGTFSALSNIPRQGFRLFSKLLRLSQNERDAKFDKTTAQMLLLKKKFIAWTKSRNMSTDRAMEALLEIDSNGNWNGNFLRKYKPELREQRLKAIAKGDAKWLLENLIYDEESDAKYQAEEARITKLFNSISYAVDEQENEKIIQKKINDWKKNFKLYKEDGTLNQQALFNPENRFLRPSETFLSEKWKNLQKPENTVLKEMYEYFQGLIDYAEDLGMIDKKKGGFIPSMFKGKLDQLVFGDIKGLFSTKGFFENLQVDAGNQYTPEIDPTDGTVISKIPVYFTSDIGVEKEDGTMDYSKKSRDLFKVFGLWTAHMYNYEAMSNLEDEAQMILEVEKNKGSLVTDQFGNIKTENGQVKAQDINDKNASTLADFINYYLYDRINGKGSDVKVKAFGKEYSLLKSAQAALRFFSLKTLALNPLSGTSNFVGGNGNALFMAQKGLFFTKKSWAKAMYETVGNKKAKAALRFMNILGEGNSHFIIDELSLSNTNRLLKEDNFYVFMRMSDKAVQYPVAVAMMMEHMVVGDKIVNITDHVKSKYDYNNVFYDLSKEERKEMMNKIDAEVEQLQKTDSLYVKGEVDKDGNFSIAGIEKESEMFSDFRNKIKGVNKRILGNMSKDDVSKIRTTLIGSALMQFRNWMPEMLEERFEGLHYDDELQAWTYGKAHTIFSGIFFKNIPNLLKGITSNSGDDVIKMAKQKYEELKRDAYDKGEDFSISEGEFIDLYKANLKSMILELSTLLAFGAAVFSVVSGDDDRRNRNKGMKQYLARALKKYYNEFAFYYNPLEFTRLTKSPLPVVGLAEDLARFMGAVSSEAIGAATGNKKMQKSAKPMKYFFKMVPIAKELMIIQATYDDKFRKEWDIKIQPGY